MSSCDKILTSASANQNCACIEWDPATGVLKANGKIVPLSGGSGGSPATAETLAGSLLAAGVKVSASSIVGAIPDASIPCTAVLACVANAPAGSIKPSAIGPGSLGSAVTIAANQVTGGTVGQVLTADAAGKGIWSAAASTPVGGAISPTSSGIASGTLNPGVTVSPSQISPAGPLPTGTTIAAADVTGLCGATIACLTPGSIPNSAIAAGPAGTVLSSNGTTSSWVTPAATPVGGAISPTSSGIASGALNPAVTVAPSQIQPGALPSGTTIAPSQISPAGPLPNGTTIAASGVTGLCAATMACISAAPSGSISPSAIGGGTTGQVFTAKADGTGSWAAPAAAPGPISPTSSGVSAGALNPAVTVAPSQLQPGAIPATTTIATAQISDPAALNKAAAAASPASTAANPLSKINGVDSAGNSARAALTPLSIVGPQSNGSGPSAMTPGQNIALAGVTAPRDGVYAVHVFIAATKKVLYSVLSLTPNATVYYIDINGAVADRVFRMDDVDCYHMIRAGAPGDSMGDFVYKGVAAVVALKAGDTVPLNVAGSAIYVTYEHLNLGCTVSLQEVGNRHIDF